MKEKYIEGFIAFRHFGIIDLVTEGIEGIKDKITYLDLINHMKEISNLATINYNQWADRIRILNLDTSISSSKLIGEINRITVVGLGRYREIIERFNNKIITAEESKEQKDMYIMDALYWASILLMQISTLKDQEYIHPVQDLEKLVKMNRGKKERKKNRDLKTANINTLEKAIAFIEENYSTWGLIYARNKKQKQNEFTLIPMHFRRWFAEMDKKNLKTKQRSIEHYWEIHSKTTNNAYIKNLIYKNK